MDSGSPPSQPDGGDDGGDGGDGGDGCTAADGGVGMACDPSGAACPCGLVCAAARCVPRAACNEVLLAWDGPTTHADGACVEGLAGFAVHAGSVSGGPYPLVFDAGMPCAVTGYVACGDAGATAPKLSCAYRVGPLANGPWFFASVDRDDAGNESPPSNETSKTIACP